MGLEEKGKVGLIWNRDMQYPKLPPFHPECIFPEMEGICLETSSENKIYNAVRQSFLDLQMDSERIGTSKWNPLCEIVKPGDTVVIKPNLVKDTLRADCQNAVVTHGSVVRPMIDYCIKAMKGRGKIIVGDAPQAESDFHTIVARNGIEKLVDYYRKSGINIELRDFRLTKVIMENGIWVDEQENVESDTSNVIVNLGTNSMFYTPQYKNADFHGGGYDRITTKRHHHGKIQEYCISKTILEADVVISIPKLKTHKKAGLTCCMKNLVGINVNKDYLPHFVVGPQNTGGDEYPKLGKGRTIMTKVVRVVRDAFLVKHWKTFGKWTIKIVKALNSVSSKEEEKDNGFEQKNEAKTFMNKVTGTPVFQGAWPGNETIWRMILDLNKIFVYVDSKGVLQKEKCRNYFYLVDGVIAGGGNGPMAPEPVACGLIAAGYEALPIDGAILKAFSIEPDVIPLYRNAIKQSWLPDIEDHKVIFNGKKDSHIGKIDQKLMPPDNWKFE